MIKNKKIIPWLIGIVVLIVAIAFPIKPSKYKQMPQQQRQQV